MKRKYLLLLVLLMAFTLSSCQMNIKEPKIKGEKINDEQIQNLLNEYELYDKEEIHDFKAKWYDLNYQMTSNLSYPKKNVNLNLEMKIDGEVYNALYKYDRKMQLDMNSKITGTVEDPSSNKDLVNVDITFKATSKYLQGREYVKVKLDAKTDLGEMSFELFGTFDSIEDQIEEALDTLNNIMDTSNIDSLLYLDLLDFDFSIFQGEDYIDELEKTIENPDANVYNKKRKYTIVEVISNNATDNTSTKKEILIAEFMKNSFQIKNLEGYTFVTQQTDEIKTNLKFSLEYKTKLFGSVSKPSNESKYGY